MKIGGGFEKSPNIQENRLVLSIDQNGKIVFFNKQCEKIAGYSKNEVIDKHILDLLIPEQHRDQWERILNSVLQSQSANSFELPWLTKDGEEIMANWTVAPVADDNDKVGDLGLVGEISPFFDDIKNHKTTDLKNDFYNEEKETKNKEFVLFNFKDKRLVFRKKSSSLKTDKKFFETKKKDTSKEKNIIFEDVETKSKDKKFSDDSNIEFEKYNHDTLVKNYENFNNSIQSLKELERKNKELEEENRKLKSDLKKVDNVNDLKKSMQVFRSTLNFIFDVIGGKKKKEEFDIMMQRLDEQKKVLNDIELQLNQDKIHINKSRDDFVKWREKLELLEEEIRKQEQDLVGKEEKVRKNLSFFIDESKQDETDTLIEVDKEGELDHHQLLDKIPNSAAIVQRGILKQVNDLFVQLLGYNAETLLEKNLLDFVTPEGFSGIENYYLKRLKGDEATSYETMFNTKSDDKITVVVSTKPVIFNGEKAEIAVFKKLTNKPNDTITTPSDNVVDNQQEIKDPNLEEKTQIENDSIKQKTNDAPYEDSSNEDIINDNKTKPNKDMNLEDAENKIGNTSISDNVTVESENDSESDKKIKEKKQ